MLPNAVAPIKSHKGDAGYDLTAASIEVDKDSGIITYDSGIAVEIPEGYVGLAFPRSSIYKKELALTNCVGVIDAPYRGSIKAKFDTRLTYWTFANTDDFQNSVEDGKLPVYLDELNQKEEDLCNLDIYKIGERFIQLVILPIPDIQFEESEDLSDSSRGEGGYGSTGV